MKTSAFLFSLIIGFVLLSIQQSVLAQDSSSGAELFNHKDFTGWKFFMRTNADPMATWSISDGMVHCTGKPSGYMYTEEKYHDFKVTVEWRFPKTVTKPVNTGVLVFMHGRDPDAGPRVIWPFCVECQGMHDHMGDFWLHGGITCNEPTNLPHGGIKMLLPSNESPVGDWTTYTAICRSNTVEIVVNGKSMNKITGVNESTGYIGIQSEGGPFDLRKVYLEPLP
ncbi:MAG TPA: DUF1080 domain-containing protein [Candidatus Acidoferrales bacterium]|jgi:hypothetical protein|nr:DUF1080 domain-containing protein [Candidatus Acidoferrales bacterium]